MAAQHACTYHSKVLTASKSKGIDLKTWLIRLHLQQFAISLLRSLMHLRADVCLLGAECFWLPQLGGQGFCFAEQFPFQNSFEIFWVVTFVFALRSYHSYLIVFLFLRLQAFWRAHFRLWNFTSAMGSWAVQRQFLEEIWRKLQSPIFWGAPAFRRSAASPFLWPGNLQPISITGLIPVSLRKKKKTCS